MSTIGADMRVAFSKSSVPHRKRRLNFHIALIGSVASLAAVASVASSAPTSATSENIPVEQLHFYQSKEGLTFAKAWGDPAAGPHSNFIKLSGSYSSPLHIHTSAYYGVVVSGVVSNERRDQPDRALRPGSYWFQRGGEPHTTKCVSGDDCLIFVTSHGKFDIRVVPDPASAEKTAGQHP